MNKKELNLKKADQVGIVVNNISEVIAYYRKLLGDVEFVQPEINYSTIRYYGEKVDSEWKMAFCDLGKFELELIEPLQGPTIYHDFIKKRGEGLHHIGFVVNNYNEIIAHAQKSNINVIQSGEGDTSRFAYFETREPGGVIYEIIERRVKRV